MVFVCGICYWCNGLVIVDRAAVTEFQSNETLGVVLECLDDGVFLRSHESLREGYEALRVSSSLPGGCEVVKLTTRIRGEFHCSTFNQSIHILKLLRV